MIHDHSYWQKRVCDSVLWLAEELWQHGVALPHYVSEIVMVAEMGRRTIVLDESRSLELPRSLEAIIPCDHGEGAYEAHSGSGETSQTSTHEK